MPCIWSCMVKKKIKHLLDMTDDNGSELLAVETQQQDLGKKRIVDFHQNSKSSKRSNVINEYLKESNNRIIKHAICTWTTKILKKIGFRKDNS